MSTSILVINGHPDASEERLCAAIADAYARGARKGGLTVARLDVGKLDFSVLRSAKDWSEGAVPADIMQAQEMFKAADHVVLVYPLWLGTMPALTKAFLEQMFRPGFSHEYVEGGFPKALLKGKSARVIVTMGMPALAYTLWFRAHSLKSLERNILGFSGMKPVRHTIIGMVEGMSDAKRKKRLDQVQALGEKGR